MDWTRIESLWALKLVRPEDMVQYAIEALQEGDESEIVLRLASLARYDLDRAREYFEEWLAETGRGHMPAQEALMIYAKDVSQEIIEGKLTPCDGAQKILSADPGLRYRDQGLEDVLMALELYTHEIEENLAAPSYLEEIFGCNREKHRKALEDSIVETAREIVNK